MYTPHYDPDSHTLVFADGPPQPETWFSGRRNVFVCGALQHPDRMTAIIGRRAPFAPAVALGYRRTSKTIGGRSVGFMIPDPTAPGRPLGGVIWLDLTAPEVERVRRVELAENLREEIVIDIGVGDRQVRAATYVERSGRT